MISLQKQLQNALFEGKGCANIACSELKDLLAKADLQEIALVKSRNGFKIDSDSASWKSVLKKCPHNNIKAEDYSDMTPQEWFDAIKGIIDTID